MLIPRITYKNWQIKIGMFLKTAGFIINKGLNLCYIKKKKHFYTKRTLGSDNIIQFSRGIYTLSILYFLPTALLKQYFPYAFSLYCDVFFFQKLSAQPAVLIWIALVASKGFKVKWDLLEPSQWKGGGGEN